MTHLGFIKYNISSNKSMKGVDLEEVSVVSAYTFNFDKDFEIYIYIYINPMESAWRQR